MLGRTFRFSKVRITLLVFTLGFLVAGISGLVGFISNSIAVSKGIEDFNELKEDEFKKDRFVQGTVQAIDFEFAEEWEERNGSKTKENRKKYYLIPLKAHENKDEVKYIAVCFSKESDLGRADMLIDQCLEYYNTGEEPVSFSTFEMTGKVGTLSEKMEGFLYDTLIKYEWGKTKEECQQYVCDYCIFCKDPPSTTDLLISIVLMVIGVAGVLIVLFSPRRHGI